MIANALKRLLAEAERANETWLKEAGQGLIDVSAINEARTALSASSDHLMVAAVDAAMVEMRNISPPLRRSECERLIRAALGVDQQATQPAEVTDEKILTEVLAAGGKQYGNDGKYIDIKHSELLKAVRSILALRPVQVPITDGWINASERVPLEADGEVFVRFTDGSIGTAWATYWHGASNAFAQWTHPDPDEDRTIAHWMKAPALAASPAQKGGE